MNSSEEPRQETVPTAPAVIRIAGLVKDYGRVRALENSYGKRVPKAAPSL